MFDIKVIPQWYGLLWQLLASTILFIVMGKFLFKPIQELLRKRQEYVEKSIRESEEAKLQALKLKEEYDDKILKAKKESSEIVSQARAYGEDIKAKAVNESKILAKQELEKGRKDLENERLKAIKVMNDEIAELAINAAEKVLREKIDSESDKKMIKSLINDLEESHE